MKALVVLTSVILLSIAISLGVVPFIERVYYASHPLPKPTAWVCDFCYYQWISPPEPPPQCPRCGQKLREVK